MNRVFAAVGLFLVLTMPLRAADEPAEVGYLRDVRPILANRCFKCHGPDLKKGGLDLQNRDSALKELKSGARAIVAGKGAESELVRRISASDDERMPPKGDALTAAQIAALKSWIDQGAKYEEHWSFVAPQRRTLPAIGKSSWVRNPIDNFVLARLEKEGLSPSPEADRTALIRRLSLDLTGLPPSPKEVDDYLQDQSRDAYEKVVDRLLNSAHYGEQQARSWLDFARYADTNGYEKDERRTIWPYRDWVIAAFNRDLPFDQFAIEQIAGDLLPGATLDQKIATGFHRNTMVNTEGGTDDEEFRVAGVVDRLNTTATVWLGLTLSCCQCHNHKYDPFTQKEYYSLYAFLNGTTDRGRDNAPMMPVPTPEEEKRRQALHNEIDKLQRQLEATDLSAGLAKWEKEQSPATWRVLEMIEAKATSGATLTKQPDGSLLVAGQIPETDAYTIVVKMSLNGVTALRVEALTDKTLGGMGPGRTPHGNFVLTGIGAESGGKPIGFRSAVADFEQKDSPPSDFTAKASLANSPKTGWAIAPQTGKPHTAIFETPVDLPAGTLTIKLDHQYGGKHTLGKFRLSATNSPRPVRLGTLPDAIAATLAIPAEKRTPAQKSALVNYYRGIAPEFAALRERITALQKQESAIKPATTLVMQELPKPRPTHVQIRGNHKNLGDPVQPGVPAKLHALKLSSEPPRLAFARWLVDPANPLVGRVTMNRIWARYFGRGFVETSEDFGIQGDLPTHPELLDWLATELIERKWSQKAMHKLIVMSATYRQTSKVPKELYERDPYNRLLARGPRLRLDAEAVRDNALAVSGLLNRKVGGPSVFPYQPDGVWANPYSGDKWAVASDGNQYRRGLYTFWRRTAPFAAFMAFDAPSREVACERRPRTNTPLQALATLNDKGFVDCSAALARRMLTEAQGERAQAAFGFRCCVSRPPSDRELDQLLTLFHASLEKYRNDAAAAKALASAGSFAIPPGADAADVAAWTVVANVLLNLDETITKE